MIKLFDRLLLGSALALGLAAATPAFAQEEAPQGTEEAQPAPEEATPEEAAPEPEPGETEEGAQAPTEVPEEAPEENGK